jgi:two-component sensor histidine kinase
METLLRLLPAPQPAAIRYGITTGVVLLMFLLRTGIEVRAGPYGFILFIPAIVAASLLFDRMAGLFALALSLALSGAVLNWPGNVGVHAAALSSFAIVGAGLVLISDGLHRALQRAQKAEREKDLLLQEMSHRVKNKFATVGAIIGLQGRQSTPEVRAALESVGARIRVIADVHDYLQLARLDGLVDLAEYLGGLCRSLGDTLRDLRPVTVTVTAEPIIVTPDKALSIGLIVNELVTNALKYAFPDERGGHVLVQLSKAAAEVQLAVSDDGVGCPNRTDTGLGRKLVTLLAAQLGGSATWEQLHPGCKVSVAFPST